VSAVYLYAVCDPRAAPPPSTGIAGEPLRLLHAGGLAALVGDRHEPRAFSEQDLWEHEHAVEQLMAKGSVLPARFGALLASDTAVQELLRMRGEELLAGLARVAGAVELAVRAAWTQQSAIDSGGREERSAGGRYLAAKLALLRRADALAQQIEARLAPVARASRVRAQADVGTAVSGAFLVATDRVEPFRRRVRALAGELAHCELLCTGPWPPYSFVNAASLEGG
jgi:hypothetical protein